MIQFFEAMKEGNMKQEEKMLEVLYGGRGDMKRHYAVDDKLYGTEQGLMQQKKAAEVADARVQKKKKKLRQKDKSGDETENHKNGIVDQGSPNKSNDYVSWHSYSKLATTTGVIGSIALVVTLIGKRSQ